MRLYLERTRVGEPIYINDVLVGYFPGYDDRADDPMQRFKCLGCKADEQRTNVYGLCAACERRALRQDYEAKR